MGSKPCNVEYAMWQSKTMGYLVVFFYCLMNKPIEFGVYHITPHKYLEHFQAHDKALNEKWLKLGRPFVCIYHENEYGNNPYFVPLYSLDPKNKKAYQDKTNKWIKYYWLDAIQDTQSVFVSKNLLPCEDPLYASVAMLNKTISIPLDMVSERKDSNNKLITIPLEKRLPFAFYAHRYLVATKTNGVEDVPTVGYLSTLKEIGVKFDPPTNHSALLLKTLEYQRRKEETKQKNQNTLMEEKEK